MCTGSHEHDLVVRCVVPDEQEIRLDMTLPVRLVLATQRVGSIARIEGLPVNQDSHHVIQVLDIPPALPGPLAVLLELTGIARRVHGLIVGVELGDQRLRVLGSRDPTRLGVSHRRLGRRVR